MSGQASNGPTGLHLAPAPASAALVPEHPPPMSPRPIDDATPRASAPRPRLAASDGPPPQLLPPQHFSGNPLDRTYDKRRKFDGSSRQDEVSLVVVAGREVCVRETTAPSLSSETLGGGGAGTSGGGVSSSLTAASVDLQALLLSATDPELDLNSESICLTWVHGDVVHQLPLYLLGQDRTERWTFALDVSDCRAPFVDFVREACGLGAAVSLQDLRGVLPALSRDAVAIAGQAVALSQWHQTHKFCSRCGAPTAPVESGLRRQCTVEPMHKAYPRTDPVVIMLVESPDGRRALLGRNKKFTPGMYTCLSGFIDQCESIEEAVRREVFEESRVLVADVAVVGSQPWPVGRYGGCELMLGCLGKARNYEVLVNTDEMEDVQWYDKEELQAAVHMYDSASPDDASADAPMSVAQLQELSLEQLGFFIPPPLAIAHHLIRLWALHEGPWFPVITPAAAAPLPAAAANAAAAPSTSAAAVAAAATEPSKASLPGSPAKVEFEEAGGKESEEEAADGVEGGAEAAGDGLAKLQLTQQPAGKL